MLERLFLGVLIMDVKASAKSKRAHSQQGRKAANPSYKTPQPTTVASAIAGPKSAKQPHKHQGGEHHAHTSPTPLPSNWDRYEQQEVSDYEDPINPDKKLDIVPKSKGADYAYLISQARTESQDFSHLLDSGFSDDFMPGLKKGVNSMLHAKGKSILSWSAEDSFNLDDNATSSSEASFMSIDLHGLAARLEKIDLPKRLFIEEDVLLPTNLYAGGPTESSSRGLKPMEIPRASLVGGLAPLAAGNKLDKKLDSISYPITYEDKSTQAVVLDLKQPDNGHIKDSELFDQLDTGELLDSLTTLADNAGGKTEQKKSERFEAAAAEAELDALLDSFGETKFLDSFSEPENPNFPGVHQVSAISLDKSLADFNTDPPPPSSSRVDQKVLDDFDTWLNTI